METKNRTVALELTTSDGTIYTVPNNYETEIQSVIVSNIAGSKRKFTFEWYDASTATYFPLASEVDIEANMMIQVSVPLWLVKGESLRGSASADNSVIITVYVKEYFIPKQI
jgi:hypothetical protein